jgi:hypothetical protein
MTLGFFLTLALLRHELVKHLGITYVQAGAQGIYLGYLSDFAVSLLPWAGALLFGAVRLNPRLVWSLFALIFWSFRFSSG